MEVKSKILKFQFDYNDQADGIFIVDPSKFTNEMALATLNFFSWTWDDENNPIEEVLKKYAIEVLRETVYTGGNEHTAIEAFKNKEGFYPIDGSCGLELEKLNTVEFEENWITVEKKE